ncbi:nuclease-related domain-containing protein [Gracilibacillus timonensis]|uniref:nuclease-related domain-containing protein n=1 Tax=Gracilibacillus timonensis TaxID=1816696 RepID=UPI0008251685|nr:nuclease-related domain-containing protein [Gracilibacillus timonensis]
MNDKLPLFLKQYRALNKYLPRQHASFISFDQAFRRYEAGYAGEDRLSYFVEQAATFSFPYIRGLRMEAPSPFQMDWLILTEGFRVIFEVKAHAGTIYFDPRSHQLTRENEVFEDPLLQVDRQFAHLRRFFKQHQINPLPTYRYVVFVSPNVILKLQDFPEYTRIITSQKVPFVLEELLRPHPAQISTAENQRIITLLQNAHKERFLPILRKYNLTINQLMKGVMCDHCDQMMERVRLSWQCPVCGKRQREAHKQALYDWALLTENRLTTSIVRDILRVDSLDATRKLIYRSDLIKRGSGKNTYYEHPDLVNIIRN